jgi:ubiquinone/menaquinone biosynthesis C-methylase UbiE
LSASTAVSFDPIASKYDQTREPPPKELIDALYNELKDRKKICDFGAGTGRIAKALEERGLEVFCVDISPKMLNLAKKRGLNNIFLADLRALPFRENSFDSGYVFSVLHLVLEYEDSLREMTRVLKGILVSAEEEKYPNHAPSHLVTYAEKLRKYGINPRGATEGARFLREHEYSRKIEVNSKQVKLQADQIIERLKNRISSVTWDAPEEVHKKVMTEIEQELKGKSWEFVSKEFLVVYDSKLLQKNLMNGKK